MLNLEKLKSGSDIRGIADYETLTKNQDISLTSDIIKRIILSFLNFIKSKENIEFKKIFISVGADCRLSSPRIKNIVINVLVSCGVSVFDCQLASTPSIALAPDLCSCMASIMISASHLPKEFNGFKFFTIDGPLSGEEISQILKNAEEYRIINYNLESGSVKKVDLLKRYCKIIINKILEAFPNETRPLEGLKIMVDAGNGCGGFFARHILEFLGADVSSSILLEPDGNFGVHIPNPENDIANEIARKAVIDSKSDIGIIFDTDVDRVGIINNDGKILNKNALIALCASIILKEHPNSVIVTDSVTSDHLKEFIESLGGFQFRHKRGYFNVIKAAREINNSQMPCFLAIETSGHAAFKEHKFIDDGAYLAAKIIIELIHLKKKNKNLSDLIKGFKLPKETKEIRIRFEDLKKYDGNASDFFKKIREDFSVFEEIKIEENTGEGVRINFNSANTNGWCLLRSSIHEPSVVINIESDVDNGCENIYNYIYKFIN